MSERWQLGRSCAMMLLTMLALVAQTASAQRIEDPLAASAFATIDGITPAIKLSTPAPHAVPMAVDLGSVGEYRRPRIERARSKKALEFGVDLGVNHATYSVGSPRSGIPVALRVGLLDERRRPNIEFTMNVNGALRGVLGAPQQSSRISSAFQVGFRLRRDSTGKVPFAGPFVMVGGGLSNLRDHITEPNAPRFRILPSLLAGVGMRHAVGSTLFRLQLVGGFDSGNRGPESALFVPTRTTVGVQFGASRLRKR